MLNPTIGYLHVYQPRRHALIFDLMDPHRPRVEGETLAVIARRMFTTDGFVTDAKGVCKLNPELARCIAACSAVQITF